jgi:hypothetical protein
MKKVSFSNGKPDLFFSDSATSEQIWDYIKENVDVPPLISVLDEVTMGHDGIAIFTDDETLFIDIETISPIF